jgi:hypothetical protein
MYRFLFDSYCYTLKILLASLSTVRAALGDLLRPVSVSDPRFRRRALGSHRDVHPRAVFHNKIWNEGEMRQGAERAD